MFSSIVSTGDADEGDVSRLLGVVLCQIYRKSGKHFMKSLVTGLISRLTHSILVGALVGWEVVALTSCNFFSGPAL